MTTVLDTEVLVVGSGAGGATTAKALAEAGVDVLVLEEGPRIEAGSVEPFSLAEMERAYRHHGSSAALGNPPIAYAEGRCVGGSTEVNSGLWARLPDELAVEWARSHQIEEFSPDALARYAERIESWVPVNELPGPAPASSGVLARGAAEMGWRSTEFARAFSYDDQGRGTKQSMTRTLIPAATAAGATVSADTRVHRLRLDHGRVRGAEAVRERVDGSEERVEVRCETAFVCGGAIQSPALLQRSGLRGRIGRGLRMHPTIKVAARFGSPLDHDDVPMHRITEFSPHLAIGGSASRRGHVALALLDSAADVGAALTDWESMFVYYAAIRSDAGGRVRALPGMSAPLVSYRLSDSDLSRLARGLVLLGEALLAAGAVELFPSLHGGPVVRRREDLLGWWDALQRDTAGLMTVHLTSGVGMSEDPSRAAADSFGRLWGVEGLHVNDASLLADAPGVNPQAAVMTIALRNAEHFLAGR